MKYYCLILTIAVVAITFTGCDLSSIVKPDKTKVTLVNNGDYPVEVTLYYSEDQNVLKDVLTTIGTRVDLTVPAGQSSTVSRDCEKLQAVIIEDAKLQVLGGVGPHTDSGVLRDGSDFGCGDTITFTFDHSDIIIDFSVSYSVSEAASSF